MLNVVSSAPQCLPNMATIPEVPHTARRFTRQPELPRLFVFLSPVHHSSHYYSLRVAPQLYTVVTALSHDASSFLLFFLSFVLSFFLFCFFHSSETAQEHICSPNTGYSPSFSICPSLFFLTLGFSKLSPFAPQLYDYRVDLL